MHVRTSMMTSLLDQIGFQNFCIFAFYRSLIMRKVVFDQVRHKLGYATTEDGKRLEILYLGSRAIVLSTKQKQRP